MILNPGTIKHMPGLLNLFIRLTKVKNCYTTLDNGPIKFHVMDKGAIRLYMDLHVVEL